MSVYSSGGCGRYRYDDGDDEGYKAFFKILTILAILIVGVFILLLIHNG